MMALRSYEIGLVAQSIGDKQLNLYPEPGEAWFILKGWAFNSSAQNHYTALLTDSGTILGFLRNTTSGAGRYRHLNVLNDSDAGAVTYQSLGFLAVVEPGEKVQLYASNLAVGDTIKLHLTVEARELEWGAVRQK